MIEERISEKYKEEKMRCPIHLSNGQEAISVGVCQSLTTKDLLVCAHRSHAPYLAKGGSLKSMIAEIYGKATGCAEGKGGSMHLVDTKVGMMGSTAIVGGSIPVGVGLAFGMWLNDINDKVVTIFFGEGATEEGVWTESLNFAALNQLPVLFVCENNFYSAYTPLNHRQSEKRDLVKIAQAYGICAEKGFGNDVEEVCKLTEKAIGSIKEKKGPYFLEFETYRLMEPCGPNFDIFLPSKEVDYWKKRCPISTYEKKLKKEGKLNDEVIVQMKEKINREVEEAFSFAENSSFPSFKLGSVYA